MVRAIAPPPASPRRRSVRPARLVARRAPWPGCRRLPAPAAPIPALSLALLIVLGSTRLPWFLLPCGVATMSRASARAVASPQIVGPRLAVAALLFTPLLGWLFQAWSGVSPALAAPLADAPSTYEAEPQPDDARLGDTFVLEVPAGTFVTQSLSTPDRGRTVEYVSFQGDTLTHFRADPALVYRQV